MVKAVRQCGKRAKGNAKFESFLHQYVSPNATSEKVVSCIPQQLHKSVEKAELLWSSRRARLLRNSEVTSWSGRREGDSTNGMDKRHC